MIKIKINNVEYSNVVSLTPDLEVDYLYSIQTMDGKVHEKVKGRRTNYNVVFYNLLDDNNTFYKLKALLNGDKPVTLTVPVDRYNTETAEFFVEIKKYNAKGILSDGTFFHNGLSVDFERVDYDD